MRKIDITQYIFLSAILVFLSYYSYCVFYPYKVIDVYSATIIGDNLEVGDSLNYKLNYCKYMDIPATVYRELSDGVVYSMTTMTTNLPVGCHEIIIPAGRVPDIAGSLYILKIRHVYNPNPFRQIEVPFETNKFTIKSDEK